jgi:hypothetical protein
MESLFLLFESGPSKQLPSTEQGYFGNTRDGKTSRLEMAT